MPNDDGNGVSLGMLASGRQLSSTQGELTLRPDITFHDDTTLDATALAAVLAHDSKRAYAPDAVTGPLTTQQPSATDYRNHTFTGQLHAVTASLAPGSCG